MSLLEMEYYNNPSQDLKDILTNFYCQLTRSDNLINSYQNQIYRFEKGFGDSRIGVVNKNNYKMKKEQEIFNKYYHNRHDDKEKYFKLLEEELLQKNRDDYNCRQMQLEIQTKEYNGLGFKLKQLFKLD